MIRPTRRQALFLIGAMCAAPAVAQTEPPIRLGLTPVFLDNDGAVILRLRAALATGTGRSIELVQRRTYQEVTGMLLEGSVDAAWLCGYPFLQHEDNLALLGVPIWRGEPLYQSYLIVRPDDPATSLSDLRGGTHAYSDPDSNSGWLVTASDVVRMGERPEGFFSRTLFAYGHRNVARSVAGGLTRSGSIDGYVWEALAQVEPELTARTKVIGRSEKLGFPPFVTRKDHVGSTSVDLLRKALFDLGASPDGQAALKLLQLDEITPGNLQLFDGIRARMRDVQGA
ncbi:MAG: PhnD/SsuA/transferrin family substrate-binding protein [Cypionkella sp.]|uniref:substrate-binding domain-containing protein n=1 Tax=Cypionkella sp. TaxID=2811411 RepID=UPI002727CF1E|nr:PhnD/SsuA/transferrin family substrate-binding protein [Cypionkella sp.]MDO8326996.1 PhnD/SsuA/transferrin family substrate-binding protein [Cypionkella sp.]